jgi:prepilin-type N-terminal cleavage/methylation domain-containing protein
MKKKTAEGQRGFTLTEIMIVVATAGLLAGIVIPNYVHARSQSQTHACIHNLKQIQWAKTQWALESRKGETTTPTEAELNGYFINQKLPVCPAAGIYTLNHVGDAPSCSMQEAGHELQHTDETPDNSRQ